MSSHEPLQSHRTVAKGSNRVFGLTFAGVFLVLAIWPWVWHGQPLRLWALTASAAFLAVTLLAEELLAPVNRLWFELGLALHAIISPIIMGLLFYGAVTPMGMLMRAFGKDLLRLSRNDGQSYWIERNPPGPAGGSMTNQF